MSLMSRMFNTSESCRNSKTFLINVERPTRVSWTISCLDRCSSNFLSEISREREGQQDNLGNVSVVKPSLFVTSHQDELHFLSKGKVSCKRRFPTEIILMLTTFFLSFTKLPQNLVRCTFFISLVPPFSSPFHT